MNIRIAAFMSAIMLISSVAVDAGQRSLYWAELAVQAHLANDGRLVIHETQRMVFDGDWNGGERTFNIRHGESLNLRGVYRLDEDGRRIALQEGSLAKTDHFAWSGGNRLRWRSRLPNDPPFANQSLTYVIEYEMTGVVIGSQTSGYVLNHDYAFGERTGPIQKFTLELTAGDAWGPAGLPLQLTREAIPPGSGVVVKTTLNHHGEPPVFAGNHSPAQTGRNQDIFQTPAWLGMVLLLTLVTTSAGLIGSFLFHESRRKRFSPLTDTDRIDEQWLERTIFSYPPETIGSAWDKKTAQPEVAAVLARLIMAGSLSSRLEPFTVPILGWRISSLDNLHLELQRSRQSFHGFERDLVDALFIDGDSTDTRRIRAHYRNKNSSFDPASKIREPLQKQVKRLTEAVVNPLEYRWLIPLALAFVSFFLVMITCVLHQQEVGLVIVSGIFFFATVLGGIIAAVSYRNRSDRLTFRMLPILLLSLLPAGALMIFIWVIGTSVLFSIGLTLIGVTVADTILLTAKTRDSAEGVMFGKQITAARKFFLHELRKSKPSLNDKWFPYLVALSLAPEVDRWVKRFGVVTTASAGITTNGISNTTGFSGGGGMFGGAGNSGSWATAASTLGSTASSSSSGGGGGSSGGGGGGGW